MIHYQANPGWKEQNKPHIYKNWQCTLQNPNKQTRDLVAAIGLW